MTTINERNLEYFDLMHKREYRNANVRLVCQNDLGNVWTIYGTILSASDQWVTVKKKDGQTYYFAAPKNANPFVAAAQEIHGANHYLNIMGGVAGKYNPFNVKYVQLDTSNPKRELTRVADIEEYLNVIALIRVEMEAPKKYPHCKLNLCFGDLDTSRIDGEYSPLDAYAPEIEDRVTEIFNAFDRAPSLAEEVVAAHNNIHQLKQAHGAELKSLRLPPVALLGDFRRYAGRNTYYLNQAVHLKGAVTDKNTIGFIKEVTSEFLTVGVEKGGKMLALYNFITNTNNGFVHPILAEGVPSMEQMRLVRVLPVPYVPGENGEEANAIAAELGEAIQYSHEHVAEMRNIIKNIDFNQVVREISGGDKEKFKETITFLNSFRVHVDDAIKNEPKTLDAEKLDQILDRARHALADLPDDIYALAGELKPAHHDESIRRRKMRYLNA